MISLIMMVSCFEIFFVINSQILFLVIKKSGFTVLRFLPWKFILALSNGAIDVLATAPANAPDTKDVIIFL